MLFSFAEARTVLEPLIMFVIGMVVYSLFVFKFYKFISRKDIFRLSKGGDPGILKRIGYGLEYLFLFPIIAFFWFFVIASILAMLSEVLTIGNIFLVSMAMMTTIRVTAHYSEDLSRDIAKLIPFGLLAVFLLDISTLSLNAPFQVLQEMFPVLKMLVYYFLFILVLEITLRLLFHGKKY